MPKNFPTICLSMIVRNEAHCIIKCLESIKPIINCYIISDTGSTDNTEQIVKDYLKDIPGKYVHNIWEDFATNRNIALDLAKGQSDYIFMIDADDYLVINDLNEWKNLNNDIYNLKFLHSSVSYYRPQLIKSTLDLKYVGVLHEYLNKQSPGTNIKNSHIIYGATGSRSKDHNKYKNDAEILEKALEKEPYNTRYMFYCAQSYRDAGNDDNAEKYYRKRAACNGWIEETYVSLLEVGKILEKKHQSACIQPNQIEETYLSAHNVCPIRAEALCYLAKFFRKRNEFQKAFFYAELASTISKPQHSLFVEEECYDWIPKDEMAVAGYYINKKQMAIELNKELLESPTVPVFHKTRIRNNLKLCQEL